jgi:hypothetical protein
MARDVITLRLVPAAESSAQVGDTGCTGAALAIVAQRGLWRLLRFGTRAARRPPTTWARAGRVSLRGS